MESLFSFNLFGEEKADELLFSNENSGERCKWRGEVGISLS